MLQRLKQQRQRRQQAQRTVSCLGSLTDDLPSPPSDDFLPLAAPSLPPQVLPKRRVRSTWALVQLHMAAATGDRSAAATVASEVAVGAALARALAEAPGGLRGPAGGLVLVQAVASGREWCARGLLNAGLARSSWTNPALIAAARAGLAELTETLLAAGADLKQSCVEGKLPLYHAAEAGEAEVAQRLLAAGAVPTAPSGRAGKTALHAAAESGSTATVQVLLAAGAAPDQATARGWTALHLAARSGRTDAATALLAAGAQPGRQAATGETARSLATAAGHSKVLALLDAVECRAPS